MLVDGSCMRSFRADIPHERKIFDRTTCALGATCFDVWSARRTCTVGDTCCVVVDVVRVGQRRIAGLLLSIRSCQSGCPQTEIPRQPNPGKLASTSSPIVACTDNIFTSDAKGAESETESPPLTIFVYVFPSPARPIRRRYALWRFDLTRERDRYCHRSFLEGPQHACLILLRDEVVATLGHLYRKRDDDAESISRLPQAPLKGRVKGWATPDRVFSEPMTTTATTRIRTIMAKTPGTKLIALTG